jgi:hypothetical protein
MIEIAVYDLTGRARSLEWAIDKYGPFVIFPAAPAENAEAWRLTALREKNDSALVTTALEDTGQPVPGVRTCFYWPDAPKLQGAGPLGAPFEGITPDRAVSGYTNVDGNVGFGMGPGATYDPSVGERGPHAAWIHGDLTRSDVILGLGMIPDDHLHLNAEWILCIDDEEPTETQDLIVLLRQLAETIHAIADIVEGNTNG